MPYKTLNNFCPSDEKATSRALKKLCAKKLARVCLSSPLPSDDDDDDDERRETSSRTPLRERTTTTTTTTSNDGSEETETRRQSERVFNFTV